MEIWFFPGAPLFLQLHRAAYLVSCSTETTMELNFTNSNYFNTVYHVQLLFFTRCTRYFFQRDTSSESNCNRSFWGQPSCGIDWLFHSLSLYTYPSYIWFAKFTSNEEPPNTLIWVSILKFAQSMGSLLHVLFFVRFK